MSIEGTKNLFTETRTEKNPWTLKTACKKPEHSIQYAKKTLTLKTVHKKNLIIQHRMWKNLNNRVSKKKTLNTVCKKLLTLNTVIKKLLTLSTGYNTQYSE